MAKVRFVEGDLTRQRVDVIVNAWNRSIGGIRFRWPLPARRGLCGAYYSQAVASAATRNNRFFARRGRTLTLRKAMPKEVRYYASQI